VLASFVVGMIGMAVVVAFLLSAAGRLEQGERGGCCGGDCADSCAAPPVEERNR